MPVWLLLALILVAGFAIAAQAAINGRLGVGLRDPVLAAFVSFLVGTLCLALVLLARRASLPESAAIAALPWWAWLGGALGAFFVTIAIVATPRVGVAALVALVVAGQLIASVALDHFGWLDVAKRAFTLQRAAGVGLLALGAFLVRFG